MGLVIIVVVRLFVVFINLGEGEDYLVIIVLALLFVVYIVVFVVVIVVIVIIVFIIVYMVEYYDEDNDKEDDQNGWNIIFGFLFVISLLWVVIGVFVLCQFYNGICCLVEFVVVVAFLEIGCDDFVNNLFGKGIWQKVFSVVVCYDVNFVVIMGYVNECVIVFFLVVVNVLGFVVFECLVEWVVVFK